MSGQSPLSCSDSLSFAEASYRQGKIGNIKSITQCLGLYKRENGEIAPQRGAILLAKLHEADSIYGRRLGIFEGFGNTILVHTKQLKERKSDYFFTREERRRAYILLGQIYSDLEIPDLASFFAERLLKEHPIDLVAPDEANTGFNRFYNEQKKRTTEISIGPLAGFYFDLPTFVMDNRNLNGMYPFSFSFSIGLGIKASLHIRENLALSTGLMNGANTLVYREYADFPMNENLSLRQVDSYEWLKVPLMIKWAPSTKIRPHIIFDPKIFLQGGLNLGFITRSKVTIATAENILSPDVKNVNEHRNLFIPEVFVGSGMRFKLARGYFSFSFNIAQTFNSVKNDNLFTIEGIEENNYKLLNYYWHFSYAHRFNLMD